MLVSPSSVRYGERPPVCLKSELFQGIETTLQKIVFEPDVISNIFPTLMCPDTQHVRLIHYATVYSCNQFAMLLT